MFCAEHSAVNHHPKFTAAKPLLCRCWHCETCSDRNRRKLIARALNGTPRLFVTLTLSPAGFDAPDQAARFMSQAWRKLRRRILSEARRDPRKRPKPYVRDVDTSRYQRPGGGVRPMVRLKAGQLPFLAVFEPHKSGWPHLHLLARGQWIAFEWLQAAWKEITGAHRVEIQAVRHHRKAAAYVAKYLGKAPQKFDGCRRFWMARDYEPEHKKREFEARKLSGSWWREAKPLWKLETEFLAAGWSAFTDGPLMILEPP